MFKRIVFASMLLLTAFVFALTLSGCGGQDQKSAIVGTWERITPAEQAGDLDLSVNDKMEFLADGTVIFSPTNASGTYSFPDSEHITFNFPRAGLGYKFTLQNDVLTLITLDGTITEYKRVK